MFNFQVRPGRFTAPRNLYYIFVLAVLILVGCQSGLQATPTVVPTAVIAAPAKAESQPIAKGPTLLREGLTLRKVMEVGGGSVRLERNPVSGDMYLLNPNGGIFKIVDLSSKASLSNVATNTEIGGSPGGMTFGPDGKIYTVMNVQVDKTHTQVIVRRGVLSDTAHIQWETLATSEPYQLSNTYYDHLYRGIVVSPDGKYVYISAGSRTEHGEVEDNSGTFPDTREVALTAKILRLPTDAIDLNLPNDDIALTEQSLIYARGTRNAYDMAYAPNGDLFAVDNGPDMDLPDELNWIREGLHYGFPWRFGTFDNPQRSPTYDPSKDLRLSPGFFAVDNHLYHNDPTYPAAPGAFTDPVINLGPDATKYRGDDGKEHDAFQEGKTLSTFTPHRSPLGLVFVSDTKLPSYWQGTDSSLSAFILSWGAAGGTFSDKGQDLLHMQLTKVKDNYEAKVDQIARGFQNPIDAVLIGDQLYVLEYGGKGAIWEITFK